MHDSGCESIPIFTNNLEEIVAGVSVVEVHGEFVLLGQLEMVWENLELLLFGRPLKSIIIQSTLPDGN